MFKCKIMEKKVIVNVENKDHFISNTKSLWLEVSATKYLGDYSSNIKYARDQPVSVTYCIKALSYS